ncbi:DNA polymerase I [Dysgonomonas sp. 25]|uniref:DNA polymerase I n=1 Tax=Dysgonomonas sp. 25 TaxID=2302933 RepID=UPI0013D0A4D7|nr:DNA polymerase I [Dysgonomonas sp. 25]NDV70442.1 DNA polymerase I [Dysgonomonas sp. 25]
MKLFLIDAYAIIYRSYYAFIKSPRINSKGQNTSAIYGFVNTLEELLRIQDPTHIAVAFDPAGGTFRHEMFEDYKSQRQETPEDIRSAIPIIKDIIDAYNIKVLEVPRYEADDVIGTMAKKAEAKGLDTYMMTPDKDFGQLASKHIFLYKPLSLGGGFEKLGSKEVMEKYGLSSPEQMIDLLGLMGDASDNIPGCPGVGLKTAQKLLSQYGTIENLLDNTDGMKGVLKERLEENKEQILMSKYLATIKTDVPIDFNMEDFKRQEINFDKLETIFLDLEFQTLIKRVIKNDARFVKAIDDKQPTQGELFAEFIEEDPNAGRQSVSSYKELKDVPHTYHLIDTDDRINRLVAKILEHDACAFDTETTGLDPITSELVGMSFSFEEGDAYYVPIDAKFDRAKARVEKFNPFFENEKIMKIGQNIKYDITVLKKYGINVKGQIFDTMIAHYLINPELRHGMDYMAETYLNYQTIRIESLIGKRGKNQLTMRDIIPSIIKDYACEDADITLKLKNVLEKAIEKYGQKDLLYNVESPLVYVLADMEYTGVRLDVSALEDFSKKLTEVMIQYDEEIREMAGVAELNINSPKQIGEVLFDTMKIVNKPRKTKTGQYVTSEEVLESLRSAHPIVGKILEYRGVKKLLSSYVDTLPQLISETDGKVHTSYNQTVTSTGRLSSSNPNLQNIPVRGDQGREIRRAFIADEGCLFFSADYSQIELRIMAHLSGDKNMIEAFNSGADIHAATAAKIYKIPIEEVTEDMRRKAKTANFGIIYGISVFGLAERLSVSRNEARELIEGYFENFPQVKDYMDEVIEIARVQGYVETMFGRKRYLPDINSRNMTVRGYAERNAINAPIQGTAADIIKIAMNRIYNRFEEEGIRSKMILQVHDELNFNVYKDEIEQVTRIVTEEMEGVCEMSVPLKIDCGTGNNWLEAH